MAEQYHDDVVITVVSTSPGPADGAERDPDRVRQAAWEARQLAAAIGDYAAAERWYRRATVQSAPHGTGEAPARPAG